MQKTKYNIGDLAIVKKKSPKFGNDLGFVYEIINIAKKSPNAPAHYHLKLIFNGNIINPPNYPSFQYNIPETRCGIFNKRTELAPEMYRVLYEKKS
jgi:hypothetical protein